jgi:PBP1b-binding outer membrane lipoprotein LpoB
MNSIKRRLSVGAVALAGLLVVAGCAPKEHVEETQTTTYVPVAPPEVVVQPAPVVVAPPPQPVTTSTTIEKTVKDS